MTIRFSDQFQGALKDLNAVVFLGDSKVTSEEVAASLKDLGMGESQVVDSTKMAALVPEPRSRLAHVYGFIGSSKAEVKAFFRFAQGIFEKDARPHFLLLSDSNADMGGSFRVSESGHVVSIPVETVSGLKHAMLVSAYKVFLQERGGQFQKRWMELKSVSDDIKNEAFVFQQEQNEVIRFTKLLSEKLLPKDVARTACRELKEIFRLEGVVFLKYDEMTDTLRLEYGEGAIDLSALETGMEVGVHGKRDPRAYFVSFGDQEWFRRLLKKSMLKGSSLRVYPVMTKDAIIGVFGLTFLGDKDPVKPNLLDQLLLYFSTSYVNALLHERISNLATRDGLTGLFNVRYFHQQLNAELNRMERLKHPLGLIFLDIDNFKNYNDTHGHPNGDKVIKLVAASIIKVFRPTDIIARYGGEEFVIAMPHATLEDALMRAKELRRLVEETVFPLEESQPLGKVTVSVGVSAFPEVTNDVKTLLKSADDCMYEVKTSGRNDVRVASAPDGHVPLFVPRKIT